MAMTRPTSARTWLRRLHHRTGGMLARQLIIGFLAVTLPGTALLSAVTLYSLSALGRVSDHLSAITHSLAATQDLHLAVTQAEGPLGEYLLSGDRRSQQEFDRLIRLAAEKASSCGTASCHGPTRTPAEMAKLLEPSLEQLRAHGRSIFETARPPQDLSLGRIEEVHHVVYGIGQRIHRMSGALLTRVEDLARQAEAVNRQAFVLVASLTVVIGLVAGGAAIVVARHLSRPLQELLFGIRRVMAGDWYFRVGVTHGGEIGELASSFNAMVDELRRHRERIEEYSRILEARVVERTEELKRKDEALLQSDKLASLGLLAAGVAHQLNNPLTSIVMNANLLLEEVGADSPLSSDLRKIDADAGRCRRIIEDLRAFARRRELQLAPSRVEAVVEQALWSVQRDVDARGIQVERDLAPDLPEVVWDAGRMVQVLNNLFLNAAQAMGRGGRLAVRSRRSDGELRIEVEDTGPGIPEAHRSRVFDPFFTTKPDGTGLGLSISHGIVVEHGGRIEVKSPTREDGADGPRGTRVTIVLPMAEVTP